MFTHLPVLWSHNLWHLDSRRFDVVCVKVLTDFPYTCRKDLTGESSVCGSLAEWLTLFLGWLVSAAGRETYHFTPTLLLLIPFKGGGGTLGKITEASTLTQTLIFPLHEPSPGWESARATCQSQPMFIWVWCKHHSSFRALFNYKHRWLVAVHLHNNSLLGT